MTQPAGRGDEGRQGDSWEQRAAGLASEVQRWMLRTSARNVRDELGDQVRKAFRGQEADPRDVWGTATTEPPRPAGEAPECTWCPVCRAARRIAEARAGTSGGNVSVLAGAADVMTAAVKEVFSGLDSVLSYRPPDAGSSPRPAEQPDSGADESAQDRAKEPEHGPDHRG
jgi:hypothetical protein